MAYRILVIATVLASSLLLEAIVSGDNFELHKGDHICLIGNSLAERMQHAGWLETLIHHRFPNHQLVIRNLGYSGDEVGGFTGRPDARHRLRSMDFGKSDEWLAGSASIPQPTKLNRGAPVRSNRFELASTRADVIFAFFGYNESHAGEAGLEAFRQELDSFLKHALAQKYNGQTPPRLVLFSPVAHENLRDRNLPDGIENNERLRLYANAMYEVAKANQVTFVDLLNPTLSRYATEREPWTIDGIHLNDHGNREIAALIVQSLFPQTPVEQPAWSSLARLRTAVLDKNFHWYQRYRTTDGYSSYGDRAFLRFEGGQTNYEVVQRELEVLDVMTSNRDQRIWALAQGRDAAIDDANAPPFITVKTNKPGPGPNGEHIFLSGDAEIGTMQLGKGLQINLFASEEQFPEMVNPVQMAFDTKGRLWVGAWPNYPHFRAKDQTNDKLLILEDTNGDGRADRCRTFADDLHNPTGFEFWGGGVLVAMAPDLLFLRDTNGDDVADVRERVLHGLDTADTHHTANSFVLDPGGALYFQEGTFHHTQVETPYGPPERCINAGVFRFEPRTRRFDVYVSYGFANPHGHVFDSWGNDIVHDGTGAVPYDAALFSGHLDFPAKHRQPPSVYEQRTRPCPGTEFLSSSHFPLEFQGNLLVGNVIGFNGILRYRVEPSGGSFTATELEPIVFSSDEIFRPSDFEMGPDGALYFTDWHNPIIGHMQHNLRDPNRDRTHGRVYRVTYAGRPLVTPAKIAGEPILQLLDLLKAPDDRVRYRTRIELSGRATSDVMAALATWIARLDPADPNYEHHLLEALWLHQSHNVVNEQLLGRVLLSPDHRASSAATRVLCYWRDRLRSPTASILTAVAIDPRTIAATIPASELPPGYLASPQAKRSLGVALDLLKLQAGNEDPRVRLEAVRACSFFAEPRAAEVALTALKHPTDKFISFVLNETLRQLEPQWKTAIATNESFGADNPAGIDYLLSSVPTPDLMKYPRSARVYLALLSRSDVVPALRQEALEAIAKQNKTDVLTELIAAMERLDRIPVGSVARPVQERSGRESQSTDADQALSELGHLLFASGDASHAANAGHGAQASLADRVRDKSFRARLARLADESARPFTRQLAYVALMTADGSLDPTWQQAAQSLRTLRDVLDSVPVIPNASLRAAAHDRIKPLLAGLPPELAKGIEKQAGTTGRYVRIELPRRGTLTLAEVQVFSDGKNIAPEGSATQSTTANGGNANRAVDGKTSGAFGDAGQTHTRENERNPWWELDIKSDRSLEAIVIWNRTDGDLGKRLDGFRLLVLDGNRNEVLRREGNPAPSPTARIELGSDPMGTIRRAAIQAIVTTGQDESGSFTTLSELIRKRDERATAVRAISRLPKGRWPQQQLQPLADAILAEVGRLPAAERTSPETRDELQLASEIAALLPSKASQRVRQSVRELGVPILLVRPIPHQILFDKSHLYVEAGRPVEIVFENVDIMPHNLVVTRPGALERVGVEGEKMAASPDAFARHFVPNLPQVIAATRLLQPQQTDRVNFTAPTELGDYPFVCTFPGHWRRMNGILHVVKNLDDVPRDVLLAASTVTQAAARPFVRAWTVADLTAVAERISSGNAVHGKELFQSMACVQCHRMKGVGGQVGPDLVNVKQKLDANKAKPIDIVTEMVEPSKVIDDKFRTVVLELTDGRVVSGVIVSQTDAEILLAANPIDAQRDSTPEPIAIRTKDVAERFTSTVSLMPQGLLNTLEEQEILDLLKYIASGGE